MVRNVAIFGAIAVASLGTACSHEQSDAKSAEQATASELVPAGTTIDAQLDTPLGTRTSSAGQSFTATLSAPLRSSTGDVVAPPGSTLRGRVVSVLGSPADTIQIKLDALDTNLSSTPISATLAKVQPSAAFRAVDVYSPGLNYDAVLTVPSNRAVGGGPAEQASPHRGALQIPVGTPMRAVLRQGIRVNVANTP